MGERFDVVWADAWEQAKPIIDAAFPGRSRRFGERLDCDGQEIVASLNQRVTRLAADIHKYQRTTRCALRPLDVPSWCRRGPREKDAHVLRIIGEALGKRTIASLKLADFWRMNDAAKKLKAPGRPERIRSAWGIMKTLRELFAYGVAAELAACARMRDIVAEIPFPQPARRRVILDLGHVEAFSP